MKKLVFMFVAMAAMSFAACGGSNAANTEAPAEESATEAVEATDEAPVEEVEAPADSTVVADAAEAAAE